MRNTRTISGGSEEQKTAAGKSQTQDIDIAIDIAGLIAKIEH